MENSTIEIESSSEKNFGIVFSCIFAIAGIYFYLTAGKFYWWIFVVALLLLIIAFTKSEILRIPNKLWFKFGLLLGRIVAPIVMALVYVTTLVPLGLFIKLTGKDLLHIKFDNKTNSYWIKRDTPIQDMKYQF